jgi:hypothetical protein
VGRWAAEIAHTGCSYGCLPHEILFVEAHTAIQRSRIANRGTLPA